MQPYLSANQVSNIVLDVQTKLENLLGRLSGEGPITIVPIMDGALFFAADLLKGINSKTGIHIRSINVKSYSGIRTTDEILYEQLDGIEGPVIVVDEFLDTGETANRVMMMAKKIGASQVFGCFLLSRKEEVMSHIIYGYHVDNESWLVGYGLDLANSCRELPEIFTMDPIK